MWRERGERLRQMCRERGGGFRHEEKERRIETCGGREEEDWDMWRKRGGGLRHVEEERRRIETCGGREV